MAKNPIEVLEAIEKSLDEKAAKILDDIAFKVKARVDSQEFIHWKTRRKPIVVNKARLVGGVLQAEVRTASGWKWGGVLVGPPGSTTITNPGGMLAIPTSFARKYVKGSTATGQTFLSKVKASMYGGTKIINGIIYGKAGWGGVGTGGGLRQRRAAGEKFKKQDLVPLFILKGSIVVRRRVIPAVMNQWGYQQLVEALKKGRLLKP